MRLWERISQQQFERNYKTIKLDSGTGLTTDLFEFESDSMHFVHVMLQAIDPEVTYSKVRTGVRRVAEGAPKTR